MYDGVATIALGLFGPEHTGNDGYKSSSFGKLNSAGQVVWSSARYNGGNSQLGQSLWLFDGVNTIDIGLTGPEHTRLDGHKDSVPQRINKSGQALGHSRRYNGTTGLGGDAWFYDPALNQTFSLQLSQRSDGYALSEVEYLGDDGLVLGTYTLFDELDRNLGTRAFYFTISDGLHDLGSLIEGGLTANGWEYLGGAIRANRRGQIIGYGGLTAGGSMAFLLTPVIPEPSGLLLAALGAPAVLARRRRRTY